MFSTIIYFQLQNFSQNVFSTYHFQDTFLTSYWPYVLMAILYNIYNLTSGLLMLPWYWIIFFTSIGGSSAHWVMCSKLLYKHNMLTHLSFHWFTTSPLCRLDLQDTKLLNTTWTTTLVFLLKIVSLPHARKSTHIPHLYSTLRLANQHMASVNHFTGSVHIQCSFTPFCSRRN